MPKQWEGRNPVTYRSTDDYPDINFDALDFGPMPDADAGASVVEAVKAMSIADAKLGLSRTFGVQPSAVEITIRA